MGRFTVLGFMIGMVVFSLFTVVFGLAFSEFGAAYGVTYDNETLDVYNKLEDIRITSESIKNTTSQLKPKSGALDVIGSFVTDAFNSLLLTFQTFDLFKTMTDEAIKEVELGDTASSFFTTFMIIITLIIFVGVGVALLMKGDP